MTNILFFLTSANCTKNSYYKLITFLDKLAIFRRYLDIFLSEKIMFPIVLALTLIFSSQIEAELQVNFYRNTCPNAELIIRQEVQRAYFRDRGIAPGLVRMHFHDCFVRVM